VTTTRGGRTNRKKVHNQISRYAGEGYTVVGPFKKREDGTKGKGQVHHTKEKSQGKAAKKKTRQQG